MRRKKLKRKFILNLFQSYNNNSFSRKGAQYVQDNTTVNSYLINIYMSIQLMQKRVSFTILLSKLLNKIKNKFLLKKSLDTRQLNYSDFKKT